jgi:hypothetical protein
MNTLTKLACPLAILATFVSAPAHAQSEGAGDMAQLAPVIEQLAPMMEQFAPMMQMMKGKMSRKRMGQMMQMVGPMMSSVMAPGGDDFTGLLAMPGIEGIMSTMDDGSIRPARRRHN